MVLKQQKEIETIRERFENDVEMYGAQTETAPDSDSKEFENDVEMYGAQTLDRRIRKGIWFENDVEMYGAQTEWYK